MFHVEHFDLVFFAKSYDYGLYDCIRSSSWNSFSKGRCPFVSPPAGRNSPVDYFASPLSGSPLDCHSPETACGP